MAGKLEELMQEIIRAGDEIACVVADLCVGSALEIASKMGIRRAVFCPAAATMVNLLFSIPKLISDGIINNEGTPITDQAVQLLPTIPAINTKDFPWVRSGELAMQKSVFKLIVRNNEAVKEADWLICNSAYDLEPAAFAFTPETMPIGPILSSNRQGNSMGSLWPEDSTCLKWLDQYPPCSVIYVAFGSITTFKQMQFQELALGLEHSKMPFLWVVRPNSIIDCINDANPQGFIERVATRGKIVNWAPQQKVLSHPSVACFLSHCGWNSTIEGVSSGVPFLCWPYSGDQFINETSICHVWKVGLGFIPDESGTIRCEEIKIKVEQLLGDKDVRTRASYLKEVALNSVRECGSSYNNLHRFVQQLKTRKIS